jgi:hypothetical protein
VNRFEIEFPEGFDDYAWEVESKGWLSGVVVTIGDRRFSVTVYDPIRLAQEIRDAMDRSGAFFEHNLLVVPIVTRAHVQAGIARVVGDGSYAEMAEDDEMVSPR